MSLWTNFVVGVTITLIWSDRCGCAPYNFFGVKDEANSDFQQALLNAGSYEGLCSQVPKTQSTVNVPTRGLFYPDDMIFTNWAPVVCTEEDCSVDRPTVTASGSNPKSSLRTKNSEKSITDNQKTIGQHKSTFSLKSASTSKHKSGKQFPRGRQKITRAMKTSTVSTAIS